MLNWRSHYIDTHSIALVVVFFGIAAKEITEACLPNGALNPVSKAINPLFATIGGVAGPVGVFSPVSLRWRRRPSIPNSKM